MRRHLLETDEFITSHADVSVMDVVTFTSAYRKVISLCNNTRDEISTDIEIHNQHILPSFVDLPHLAANIYCAELGNRLRAFLVACPPTGPSPPVADLVIAAADFQKDLTSWKIRYIFLHIASSVFITICKVFVDYYNLLKNALNRLTFLWTP
jgi:hypothetical protein